MSLIWSFNQKVEVSNRLKNQNGTINWPKNVNKEEIDSSSQLSTSLLEHQAESSDFQQIQFKKEP